MNLNLIKIIMIYLIAVAFILSSCDKISWTNVNLQHKSCNNSLMNIDTFTEISGVVSAIPQISDSSKYIFIEQKSPEQISNYLIPCNLPNKYKIEGLNVIFSGFLKAAKDDVSTPILIAHPFTLTNLKVEEL